jgi:hypothetical protein
MIVTARDDDNFGVNIDIDVGIDDVDINLRKK